MSCQVEESATVVSFTEYEPGLSAVFLVNDTDENIYLRQEFSGSAARCVQIGQSVHYAWEDPRENRQLVVWVRDNDVCKVGPLTVRKSKQVKEQVQKAGSKSAKSGSSTSTWVDKVLSSKREPEPDLDPVLRSEVKFYFDHHTSTSADDTLSTGTGSPKEKDDWRRSKSNFGDTMSESSYFSTLRSSTGRKRVIDKSSSEGDLHKHKKAAPPILRTRRRNASPSPADKSRIRGRGVSVESEVGDKIKKNIPKSKKKRSKSKKSASAESADKVQKSISKLKKKRSKNTKSVPTESGAKDKIQKNMKKPKKEGLTNPKPAAKASTESGSKKQKRINKWKSKRRGEPKPAKKANLGREPDLKKKKDSPEGRNKAKEGPQKPCALCDEGIMPHKFREGSYKDRVRPQDASGQIKLPHSMIYWASFLDGKQRVLYFTKDHDHLLKVEKVGQLERCNTEFQLEYRGIGISLVDDEPRRREILYVSVTGSGVQWISRHKHKTNWKPISSDLNTQVRASKLNVRVSGI